MSSLFPNIKDMWGAILLFSCFLQAGLVFGILRSFGIFFPEFLEYFGSAAGSVSWVTSCAVAVQQLMSPLGCALALRFGSRPVVIFGGFLSFLGMFLASFSTELYQLYLSIGGVSGWLCDLTGDFSLSFLITGSFLLLGALIILTLPGIFCKTRTVQSEIGTPRNSRTINHVPPAKHNGTLASGRSDCGGEEQPLDLGYRTEADVPSSHPWPPMEERAGHNKLQGDQSSQEKQGCLQEATAARMPLSVGKLLEYHSSSPVTILQLSSNGVL